MKLQVHYMLPEGEWITEDWEVKNRAQASRRLRKIPLVGTAQLYDYDTDKIFYYKPRRRGSNGETRAVGNSA